MEIQVTVDDSKAYTAPWTVKLHYVLVPDTDLLEYHCDENEQDLKHFVERADAPGQNGECIGFLRHQTFALVHALDHHQL